MNIELDYLDDETWIRTYNNDCFTVFPQIEAGSVDLVLTDPPYGITGLAWDVVPDLDKLFTETRRVLKPDGIAVMTANQPFTTQLILAGRKYFSRWYCRVWVKSRNSNPRQVKLRPLPIHEDVIIFYNSLGTYNPQNWTKGDYSYEEMRYPTSVMYHDSIRAPHPTQKPVSLFEDLIRTYSNEGDHILDPFMGSGTTGVAAFNTCRSFIGVEKEKIYFDMCTNRLCRGDEHATE